MSFEGHELPLGWQWMPFQRIVESMKNGIYKPGDAYGSGTPCLRMYNIADGEIVWRDVKLMRLSEAEMADYGLLPGDVLVNRVNSRELVGKAAVIPDGLGPLVFESKNIRLRVRREVVLPQYVSYFLRTRLARDQIEPEAKQTVGMATINQADINNWQIPIPGLDEQSRIVARVVALLAQGQTARLALERVPALLKRFRQAVLAAAFSGKLTERDPNDEPAAVLLKRIKGELGTDEKATNGQRHTVADGLVTDKLPKLPQGWAWSRFDDLLIELKNGYFAKTPDHQPPGIPILRISAVRPRSVVLDEPRYLRGEDESRVGQYRLRNGDLLFTRYNGSLDLVGVCGMVRNLDATVIYPDKLIRARVVEQYIEPGYLELYFSTRVPRQIVETKAKSSAGQQGISGKDLRAVLIAIAPVGEQRRIVAKVKALLERADAIELAVEVARRRAEKVDQAILARAFRGEL